MAEGIIIVVKKGYTGTIRGDDGKEYQFNRRRIVEGKEEQIQKGRRVEFEPDGERASQIRLLNEVREVQVSPTAISSQIPVSATTVGPQEKRPPEPRPPSRHTSSSGNYRFLNPYNFVRLLTQPRPENDVLGDCPPPPHDRYVGLTGRITCKVEAVTPLFVSDSHAVVEDNGHKTYRFFQVDGQPALPASSLRGMVRAVFEAVTNSCFVVFDRNRRLPYRDINAARRMKPGVVKELASDDKPGLIALCKEAAVGAYEGSRKPIVLDSSWRTGDEGYAIIRRPKKGAPYVEELSRQEKKGAVKGRLKITGKNIENKFCERFFYGFDEERSSWVEFGLRQQQDYNAVLSAQLQEPGFSSTHQHPKLSVGDLVYVALENDGKTVKSIAATKVPRLLYQNAIGTLLRYEHLQRCRDYNRLCPACRVFGWVREGAEDIGPDVPTAYAGRVRFSHGILTKSAGELPETTLAVLSTPKPTTTPFYLLNKDGRPDPTVTYDTEGARLRGRKFYRHQGKAKPEEYQSDKKSDQNRTVRGALQPGATFTFTVDFENLAPLELGALLYALELEEGLFHRLGYAKPLGFGSVKVSVESMEVIDWAERLRSVEAKAGWKSINGAQYKQEFLQAMQKMYESEFDEVLADLRALLGAPPDLPIHYPRPTRQFDPNHPQFEWFVGNKRRIEKRQNNAVSLPLAKDDAAGLPLIKKDGG